MTSVSTMVSITHCWRKRRAEFSASFRHALLWGVVVTLMVPGLLHAQATPSGDAAPSAQPVAPVAQRQPASRTAPQAPAVSPLELRRQQGDALELTARLRFDLPESVEDALYKGLS